AFKDSMVHGILQFTPSIAFRYVLHRCESREVGGQAVLGRQVVIATPWLTERHGYDPTSAFKDSMVHGILQFTPSIAFRYVLHR
ncbi:hypothetical protein RYX56_24050, partial [Alkalihalophilus lindianensis]